MGILEFRRKMKLLGLLAASASAGIVESTLFLNNSKSGKISSEKFTVRAPRPQSDLRNGLIIISSYLITTFDI